MDCSDTHLLLDWPELDEPRASSHIDDDDADEPRRLARTVADVLDTTARCTLRRQRTAVEVAIRLNPATVRRQQRVVAAAAPTGDPAMVLSTLDVARLVLRDGAGGTDASWVVGSSGACDAATCVCTYQCSGGGEPALRQCVSVGGTEVLAVNVGAATTGFQRATPQSRRHERCAGCPRGRVGLLRVPLTASARPQRQRQSPYGLPSTCQRQLRGLSHLWGRDCRPVTTYHGRAPFG